MKFFNVAIGASVGIMIAVITTANQEPLAAFAVAFVASFLVSAVMSCIDRRGGRR